VRVSAHPLSCSSDLLSSSVDRPALVRVSEPRDLVTSAVRFRCFSRPREFTRRATDPSTRVQLECSPCCLPRSSIQSRRDHSVASFGVTPRSPDLLPPSVVVRITGWRLVRTHAADAARVLPSRAPHRPLAASLLAAGAPPDRRPLGASLLAANAGEPQQLASLATAVPIRRSPERWLPSATGRGSIATTHSCALPEIGSRLL
jgi:hypothetical protein